MKMKQRLSVVTLGVEDLPAMRQFYAGKLGWQPAAANGDIVFFKLNGLLLSLYGRKQLATFLNLPLPGNPIGFRGFTLAYNVNTAGEVLDLYQSLHAKGVKILKEPFKPDFGGTIFCFADIEENSWEVAYNPFVPLDGQGNVITHYPIDHL